jgi:hypothetical protein
VRGVSGFCETALVPFSFSPSGTSSESATTRQSARLKPDGDGAFEEDVSPTKVVDNQNNQPDESNRARFRGLRDFFERRFGLEFLIILVIFHVIIWPRTRRPRHPRTVPESSRTTRQSARLKPDGDGAFDRARFRGLRDFFERRFGLEFLIILVIFHVIIWLVS